MMKHSPAPWTPLAGKGRTTRVVDANDELVATLPFDGSNQCTANTALLVAAPYLLAAARQVDREADAAPRGATVPITNEALDALGRAIDIAMSRPGPGPFDEIPQDIARLMLAALKRLTASAEINLNDYPGDEELAALADAQAAIAQAEGRP